MLAYAIALDEAQPWLDVSVPAPSWVGSGEAASLSTPDLDVAYHGFMSAPAWGLAGRSQRAVEAVAGPGEAEQELLDQLSRLEQAEGTASGEGGGETVYERPQTGGVTPETEVREEIIPGWVEEPKTRTRVLVGGSCGSSSACWG